MGLWFYSRQLFASITHEETHNVIINNIFKCLGDVLAAASSNKSLNKSVEPLLEDLLRRRRILPDTRWWSCSCLSCFQGINRLGNRGAKDRDGYRKEGCEHGEDAHFGRLRRWS